MERGTYKLRHSEQSIKQFLIWQFLNIKFAFGFGYKINDQSWGGKQTSDLGLLQACMLHGNCNRHCIIQRSDVFLKSAVLAGWNSMRQILSFINGFSGRLKLPMGIRIMNLFVIFRVWCFFSLCGLNTLSIRRQRYFGFRGLSLDFRLD